MKEGGLFVLYEIQCIEMLQIAFSVFEKLLRRRGESTSDSILGL
jgi:hypothetical protein